MRVIIIGGTAAGMSAAAKLRRVNKEAEIIVYEKRDYISFGACGLPYYVGNFFESTDTMIARTKQQAISSGIDVLTEYEVTSIDVDKKRVIAKNL